MNNLECRKQGFNKIICKRTGKEIKLSECINCPYKEYKKQQCSLNNNKLQNKIKMHNKSENNVYFSNKMHNKSQKTVQIKKKTYKLAKMERERFSLFTNDLDHCIICGKTPINKHEIFFGNKNRHNSIKYGLVIPLCTAEHHNQVGCTGIHFDKSLREEWQIKGQKKFQEVYPDLDFLEIFGKNYIK